MSEPKQFLRRVFNWQVIVAAILLIGGYVGLSSLQAYWQSLLAKERVPLARSLESIPHELGPYELLVADEFPESMIKALGSSDYISWVFRDTRISPGSPGGAIRLHVVYYTGNQEPVSAAHVPEICYVGGGYKSVEILTNELVLDDATPDDASSAPNPGDSAMDALSVIPVREFVYMIPGMSETGSVLYFFIYNGRFIASRKEVTFNFMDPTRYVYYCKVEINAGSVVNTPSGEGLFQPGTYTSPETHRIVAEFLAELLPHLQECLPSEQTLEQYNNPSPESHDNA